MSARRWGPPLAWAALILVVTSVPLPPGPAGPPGADKVLHFALYCVLGLLVVRATPSPSWRALFIPVLAIALFGGIDEWHQRFVPGRFADTSDWLADAIGGGVGAVFALALARRRETVP